MSHAAMIGQHVARVPIQGHEAVEAVGRTPEQALLAAIFGAMRVVYAQRLRACLDCQRGRA